MPTAYGSIGKANGGAQMRSSAIQGRAGFLLNFGMVRFRTGIANGIPPKKQRSHIVRRKDRVNRG